MSRTFIPDPHPIDPKVTKQALLDFVHERLEVSMGDYDKCDEVDNCHYYAGLVDAYAEIEHHMTKTAPEEGHETAS